MLIFFFLMRQWENDILTLNRNFFFFFCVENTKYFNTHIERWENVLKKLTMVYI